jgi:hypothetical protein
MTNDTIASVPAVDTASARLPVPAPTASASAPCSRPISASPLFAARIPCNGSDIPVTRLPMPSVIADIVTIASSSSASATNFSRITRSRRSGSDSSRSAVRSSSSRVVADAPKPIA